MSLHKEIIRRQQELVELAKIKGISHPDVLKFSQELDKLIIKYQLKK